MSTVSTTDPRTGLTTPTTLEDTSPAGVDAAARDARADGVALSAMTRQERAVLLERIADAVGASASELVALAGAETGLGEARLEGEIVRAAGQFRLFADVLRDGAYLEAMIDHPDGAGPDVRRMLVPIGPVAVFGASNFPFAFSVLGGDTASALAAGCGVIAKAHPAHPLTSARSAEVIAHALANSLPGVAGVRLVFGLQAGLDAVRHPSVAAATLTGSVGAARGIMAAIAEREDPIPFFGELSSINPLLVFPGAARSRGAEIAAGLFDSFTGSGGQLCTKPGCAFVPTGSDGDVLVAELAARVAAAPPVVLLSSTIREHFESGVARQIAVGAEEVAAASGAVPGAGFDVRPRLLQVDESALTGPLAAECFGPVLVVVRYDDPVGLPRAVRSLPPSLTVSIHADADDDRDIVRAVTDASVQSSGRIVFDGYPTGVRVSWAQHHGGPWPSTNSQHTSVGATAIRRFLRPVAFQNAPEWALPDALREGTVIPRRVDGVLVG